MVMFSGIFGSDSARTMTSNGGGYYRRQLSEPVAYAYDEIAEKMSRGKCEFSFGGYPLTTDEAYLAYELVTFDNPELMFGDGCVRTRIVNGNVVSASVGRCMSAGAYDSILGACRQGAESIASVAARFGSDMDKVDSIYRSIVKGTEYGMSSPYNQNMASVFRDGCSCCAGYSHAFQYALSLVGIDSIYVSGYVNGHAKTGAHAWNIVWLDGKPAHIDITWGDPVFAGIRGESTDKVSYDYFGLSDAEISVTHAVDDSLRRYVPGVSGRDCHNWYRAHGLCFDTFDLMRITSMVQNYLITDEFARNFDNLFEVAIRFTNRDAFDRAQTALWHNSGIFDIVNPVMNSRGFNVTNASYSGNDEMLTQHYTYFI